MSSRSSSTDLQNGESYMLYTGGSSSGSPVDSLYSDGTYTPGTETANFTTTSIVTGGGGEMLVGPDGGKPGGNRSYRS